MAGGSYNVERAEASDGKKDTSFRSCMCALLVVLCICLIGLLVTSFIAARGKTKQDKNGGFTSDMYDSDYQDQDRVTTSSRSTTTTTTRIVTEFSRGSTSPSTKIAKNTETPANKFANGQANVTTTVKPSSKISWGTSENVGTANVQETFTTPSKPSSGISWGTSSENVGGNYGHETANMQENVTTTSKPSSGISGEASSENVGGSYGNETANMQENVTTTSKPSSGISWGVSSENGKENFGNETANTQESVATTSKPSSKISWGVSPENVEENYGTETTKMQKAVTTTSKSSEISWGASSEKVEDNYGSETTNVQVTTTSKPSSEISWGGSSENVGDSYGNETVNIQESVTTTTKLSSGILGGTLNFENLETETETTEKIIEAKANITTTPIFRAITTSLPPINPANLAKSTTDSAEETTSTTQNVQQTLMDLRSIAFSNSNDVCETPSCKSAAVDILAPMNHSVDPCDDFYQFSCGRFAGSKSKANERFLSYVNRIDDASAGYLKGLKVFFDSCVAHESEFLSSKTVQQARLLVDNVGELRVDNSKDVSLQELSELLGKLILRKSVPFFDVDVNVYTSKGLYNYILQLKLPQHSASEWSSLSENRRRCLRLQSGKTYGENLNLTEMYEDFLECQKNYSVYLDSVENVVRTLGLLENVKNNSQLLGIVKEIRFTVEDILKILEILPPPHEVRRSLINQDRVTMTLSDLTNNFPEIEWSVFFKTLVQNPGASVEVYLFKYFVKAFQELNTLGHKRVFNALLAIYAQDVYSNVVFEPVTRNREDFCAERTIDLFPDLVNYIYKVNERNLDAERNATSIIFERLRAQLSTSIDSASNWMESDVAVQFQAKLSALALRFSEIGDFDAAELERNYQNCSMEEDAYVKNLERAMVERRQRLYSLWGKNLQDGQAFQFLFKPDSNRPLAFPGANVLYVPDGMLKNVHEDRPFYLSVSSVGWRLAKVLAGIFDPVNIKEILPKSTTYNSLVETTKDQLKHVNQINFRGRDVFLNVKWNGSLSANERLVDNIAFRLLLDASQPDDSQNELPLPWISLSYSREKIVFIATIQEFCEETTLLDYMERIYESEILPASLMAESVLINSESFATTFGCKLGSSMNMFDVRYQFPYLEKVEDYNNYEYDISN